MNYEWGVWCTTDNELHRFGMTEENAREWVRSWNEEVAPEAKPNIFRVCRRPLGEWNIEIDGNFYRPTTN